MHNIVYWDLTNPNRAQVQSDGDALARADGDGNGLGRKIRWVDERCASRDKAEARIKEIDNGWYDQVAVSYVDSSIPAPLLQKYEDALAEYKRRAKAPYYAGHKAAYITCRGCGSKISRTHLLAGTDPNRCPVCRADLRPESALETVAAAERRYKALYGKCIAAAKKPAAKKKIRWLVKLEYHS